MNKLAIIGLFLLFVVTSVLVVAHANTAPQNNITLVYPSNQYFNRTGAITFGFNVSGNVTTGYNCSLYTNSSGVFQVNVTNESVSNNTVTNITLSGLADGGARTYNWTVGCTRPGNISTHPFGDNVSFPPNGAVNGKQVGSNFTWIIDTKAPRIELHSPNRNATWLRNGSVAWNLTAYDNNTGGGTCQLATNLSISNDHVGVSFWDGYRSASPTVWDQTNGSTYASGTRFNLTLSRGATGNGGVFGLNGNSTFFPNNTGHYKWDIICNDSANNFASAAANTLGLVSTNATLFIDPTAPRAPVFVRPNSFVVSTDYTPLLEWTNNSLGELNFSLWEIKLTNHTDTTFAAALFARNYTNISINETTVNDSNISGNFRYIINVTMWDLAGNANSSTITYTTDSICHTMVTGWNICAITTGRNITAQQICNEASCDFVSLYNETHGFTTFTQGASANAGLNFTGTGANATRPRVHNMPTEESVVFVHVASNQTWENRTWDINHTTIWWNFTNASSGWNLVPILNQTNVTGYTCTLEHGFCGIALGHLDRVLNGNGTGYGFNGSVNSSMSSNMVIRNRFMSLFNPINISQPYQPYVYNRSINNDTFVRYGQAVWVHFNKTYTAAGQSGNSIGGNYTLNFTGVQGIR